MEDLQSAQKPIGRLVPEEIPTGNREGEQWSYWKWKALGILAEKGRIRILGVRKILEKFQPDRRHDKGCVHVMNT